MSDPTDPGFLLNRLHTVFLALTLGQPQQKHRRSRTVRSQVIGLKGTLTVMSGIRSYSKKGKEPRWEPRCGRRGLGTPLLPKQHGTQPHPPDHPVVTQDAFPGASSQPLDSLLIAKYRGQSVSSDLSEAADSVNHFLSSVSSLLLAGFLNEETKLLCKINIDHKGYVSPLFFNISFFNLN